MPTSRWGRASGEAWSLERSNSWGRPNVDVAISRSRAPCGVVNDTDHPLYCKMCHAESKLNYLHARKDIKKGRKGTRIPQNKDLKKEENKNTKK